MCWYYQAVIVLEAVRTVWQPVLSTSVWEFVIGNLVEAAVKRLIDEVLAFDDISVGEGELVWCLLHLPFVIWPVMKYASALRDFGMYTFGTHV